MSTFSASDIVEFAVRIEQNGENFYRYAVQLAKDQDAKDLFSRLADDEVAHQKIFRKIFTEMEKVAPPESYDGEYDAYLRNYVDNNVIFKKDALDAELAHVKDTASALDFAMRRELDSMLYYHEIKRLVSASEHGTIDRVIEEERRHYSRLCNIKKRLGTG
jgi:rubrerythrin